MSYNRLVTKQLHMDSNAGLGRPQGQVPSLGAFILGELGAYLYFILYTNLYAPLVPDSGTVPLPSKLNTNPMSTKQFRLLDLRMLLCPHAVAILLVFVLIPIVYSVTLLRRPRWDRFAL
jgi:hypothetical protein